MAVTKSATSLVRTANDFVLTFIMLSTASDWYQFAMYRQSIQDTSEIFTNYDGAGRIWLFFISTHNCVLKCACTHLCVEMSLGYGKCGKLWLPGRTYFKLHFCDLHNTDLQMDLLKRLLSSMSQKCPFSHHKLNSSSYHPLYL